MKESDGDRRHGRMSREQLEEFAAGMVAKGQADTFLERVAERMDQQKIKIPTVTVEYKNIHVEADALVGSAAIPSLTNTAKKVIQTATFQRHRETKRLNILKDISGVLKPGKMTLVLGPPSSGKSVFLKALSGRLKQSNTLRVSGDIKYNGVAKDAFVIERTAAHVQQTDNHLGSLTVQETLEFSHKCQLGDSLEWDLASEMKYAKKRSGGASNVSEGQEMKAMEHSDTGDAAGPAESSISDLTDEEFDDLVQHIWGTDAKVGAVIKFLGLSRCIDTLVGDWLTRGISGGEKKRLTSAEMLVGPKSLLLMDEISTGLDSATLFSVMKWLTMATHAMRLNTVCALLQPPPETFMLFDDVILLTDGKVVFHGPIREAVPFFTAMGFHCPVRKDPASFLQEITTPQGQLDFATDELRNAVGATTESVSEDDKPKELLVSLDDIQEAFWKTTDAGKALKRDLDNPFDPLEGHPKALVHDKYALPLAKSTKLATQRQMKMTFRDKVLARGRIGQVVIMGLMIGSLFWQLDTSVTASRAILGVMFLNVMFMALGGMPQLAITMMNKAVFLKQRDNYFFPALSYALGMAFTQLPFSFVESTLFSIITYFMIGLTKDSARYFFIYWAVIFTTSVTMSSLFRFVATATPNMVVANSLGGLTLLLLVVNSGFTIVRESIPDWWIWAYWISPFAHGIRGLAINEFTSPRWSTPFAEVLMEEASTLKEEGLTAVPSMPLQDVLGKTVGEVALKQLDFHTEKYWIGVSVAYLWGLFFTLTLATAVALRFVGQEAKQAVIHDEKAIAKARREAYERKKQLAKRRSDVEMGPIGTGFSVAERLPFQPITLVFKNLSYTIDAPKAAKHKANENGKLQLLTDITGYACPGVLTALMGGSGAGKTTLMDVIAGRKTMGVIEGEILVNGHPKEQLTWSRVVGYVEQFDTHSASATVREALEFSARLRLEASVDDVTVRTVVDEVLNIVDLTESQHAVVGTRDGAGLSVEQRKRLSIAVELVANPSVMFMDEPTTGLDARSAATVMRAVKNVALNGRTVMVTIHQPSIEIFEAFDFLLLLQMGGTNIYFGPLGRESAHFIHYLEAIQGVPKIEPGYNPATWMLEVTGGAARTMVGSCNADFTEAYKNSELNKRNDGEVDRLAEESKASHQPLALSSRYAIPTSRQVRVLIEKFMIAYWRTPAYNFVRMMITIFTSFVFGSVYWGVGSIGDGADVGDVQNVMGILFAGVSFMGMINLITILPVVTAEREVYYREKAASMYSPLPYAAASGLVEVPYLITQAVVFVSIVFFMIQFEATTEKFFFFMIVFLESITLYTFFGQMLAYVTPTPPIAQVIGAGIHFLWQLFNGFLIEETQMPRGWKWMNTITPTTYIIYGLSVSQLGDNESEMIVAGERTTVKDFLEERFGYEYGFRWWCVGILGIFILVFRILGVLGLKYVQHQSR